MQIPDIQPTLLNIHPHERDYSPLARAGAERSQFFAQAFAQFAQVGSRIAVSVQNTNYASAQNAFKAALGESEKQLREQVVQLRIQGKSNEEIDGFYSNARSTVMEQALQDQRLAAPGLQRDFQVWADDAWQDFKFDSLLRANTQMMALEQYRATQTVDEYIKQADGDGLSQYLAQKMSDGTFSPEIHQRLLDSGLYRIGYNQTLAEARSAYQSTGDLNTAIELINANTELAEQDRGTLLSMISDEDRRARELKRAKLVEAVDQQVAQFQLQIVEAWSGNGTMPPTIQSIKDAFPSGDTYSLTAQARTIDAVNAYWNAKGEENRRAQERADQEARGDQIVEPDPSSEPEALAEVQQAYSNPFFTNEQVQAVVLQNQERLIPADIVKWMDSSRTRTTNDDYFALTEEVNRYWKELIDQEASRGLVFFRGGEAGRDERIAEMRRQWGVALDQLRRMTDVDNGVSLSEALRDPVTRENIMGSITEHIIHNFAIDSASVAIGSPRDEKDDTDAEMLQSMVDSNMSPLQVQQYRPHLERLKLEYEAMFTRQFGSRPLQSGIDPDTGKVWFFVGTTSSNASVVSATGNYQQLRYRYSPAGRDLELVTVVQGVEVPVSQEVVTAWIARRNPQTYIGTDGRLAIMQRETPSITETPSEPRTRGTARGRQ